MNCSVVSGAKQDRRVDKPGQSDIRSWEDALRTGSTRRGRPVCMNFNVDAKCCICVWTRHARTCLIKSDFVIFFGVLVFFKRDFYPWISLDCGRYHSTVERAKFIPVQAYQAHTVISRSHSNRSRENIDIPTQPYHAPRSISNHVVSQSRAVQVRRNINVASPVSNYPVFSPGNRNLL